MSKQQWIIVKSKPCPNCGKQQDIRVNRDDYRNWRRGQLIQFAMPYLTASEREALKTGYCDACWGPSD